MADINLINTQPRPKLGTRESVRLRKKGLVPAIVYGHKQVPVSVSITLEELLPGLKHHNRRFDLKLDGKNEPVLLQDVQYDYLAKDILHVDFRRIDLEEKIRTTLTVELKGIAKGALSGGVLEHQLHTLHIECLASNVPVVLIVKIEELQLGQAIHVGELQVPAGVRVLDHADLVVVQVKAARTDVILPTSPLETGGVEPEVITSKKKEKGEDEE